MPQPAATVRSKASRATVTGAGAVVVAPVRWWTTGVVAGAASAVAVVGAGAVVAALAVVPVPSARCEATSVALSARP